MIQATCQVAAYCPASLVAEHAQISAIARHHSYDRHYSCRLGRQAGQAAGKRVEKFRTRHVGRRSVVGALKTTGTQVEVTVQVVACAGCMSATTCMESRDT